MVPFAEDSSSFHNGAEGTRTGEKLVLKFYKAVDLPERQYDFTKADGILSKFKNPSTISRPDTVLKKKSLKNLVWLSVGAAGRQLGSVSVLELVLMTAISGQSNSTHMTGQTLPLPPFYRDSS